MDSWIQEPAGRFPAELDPLLGQRRVEPLPVTLLWEPLLANKADPRISFSPSNLETNLTRQTADISIGQAFGLVRFRPRWSDRVQIQVDGFAVIHARFSEYDFLFAEDYRAGVPITMRWGNWQGKIGFEHVSTHLGDEVAELNNLRRTEFQKDEIVGGIGYIFQERLRIYGQAAYAYNMVVQDPFASRWRFDVGSEYFSRGGSGPLGQPFAAFNVNFDGAKADFSPTLTVQAGWMWRKLNQRFGQFRVYGEYFNGRSQYGQFASNREEYAAFGISLDY